MQQKRSSQHRQTVIGQAKAENTRLPAFESLGMLNQGFCCPESNNLKEQNDTQWLIAGEFIRADIFCTTRARSF
jgi:hypothetical protein